MDDRPTTPSSVLGAIALTLACAACDIPTSPRGAIPPDRWVASATEAEIAARGRQARSAQSWVGACVGWDLAAAGLTASEHEAQLSAQGDAAGYGDPAAARCHLAASRELLDSELRSAEPSDLMLQGARMRLHEALELAYLLGLGSADDRDGVCDDVGEQAHGGELVVRHQLADAAALGLLSQAELEAAKARDAARPPCSTHLEPYRFARSGDWAPAETDAAPQRREEMAQEAQGWAGACVDWGTPRSSTRSGDQRAAQQSAAYLGDLEALECHLQSERLRSQVLDDFEESSEAMRQGRLLALHEALYLAYLRGLDVAEELDAVCNLFESPSFVRPGEQAARHHIADSVALGRLSQAELEAAQARDSVRPPCSDRADQGR